MEKKIMTKISWSLYDLLKKERAKLIKKQLEKHPNRRKKRITLYDASESLYKKLTR